MVIEPSVNTEAVHVPSTPCNNGNKLNNHFEPYSQNQTKWMANLKLANESFANTETIQDPSTPCTTANINEWRVDPTSNTVIDESTCTNHSLQ